MATICSLPVLRFVDLAHLHLCQPVSQGVVQDCGPQECGYLPLTRAGGPGPGWSSDPVTPTRAPAPLTPQPGPAGEVVSAYPRGWLWGALLLPSACLLSINTLTSLQGRATLSAQRSPRA